MALAQGLRENKAKAIRNLLLLLINLAKAVHTSVTHQLKLVATYRRFGTPSVADVYTTMRKPAREQGRNTQVQGHALPDGQASAFQPPATASGTDPPHLETTQNV